MATAKTAPERVARDVKRKAEHADENPWIERIARFGYVMRGALYIIIGLIAAGVALGTRSTAKDPTGAITELGSKPYGEVLLILMAIGLAGYSMWGFVRAIWDPWHRGDDASGLLQRAGFLTSAISYAVIAIPTVQFLTGHSTGASQTQKTQDLTARLLQMPFGKWAVILIGLFFVGVAIAQFYTAVKADFRKDLRPTGLTTEQQELAIRIGQFGHAARGVVFSLVGIFIVQAALTLDPKKAQGLDGALMSLMRHQFGPLLLGIVALGLVAFGIYSLIAARWNRMT